MNEWISPTLTIVIAAFVAYIAWKQYLTAKLKLTLDLFDRRYKVWRALEDFLLVLIRRADVSDDDFRRFVMDTGDAAFLFPEDVPEYLQLVRERAAQLQYWKREYRSAYEAKSDDYDHRSVVDGIHKELTWLTGQIEPAREHFKKYLSVAQ